MTSRERAELDDQQPVDGEPAERELRYVSIKEAALSLGVSYRTLWRQVHAGKVPAMKVGAIYRIEVGDLDRLRHDPDEVRRQAETAVNTRRPPAPRPVSGRFARLARGIDE